MKFDYTPLLPDGFQTIGAWQLDKFFLEPFPEYDQKRRLYLTNQLRRFLEELHKLDVPLEVWIDGSFTTRKTEPDDIDMVVWINETDAESLSTERLRLLDSLLHIQNHERIKAAYDIDVYLADPESALSRTKWTELFGKDRSSLNSKGIFVVLINHV